MLLQKYRDMYQLNCGRNFISFDSSSKFLYGHVFAYRRRLFSVYFLLGWRRGARDGGPAGRCAAQRHLAGPAAARCAARTAAAARRRLLQSAATRNRERTSLRPPHAATRDARVSNVVHSRPVRRSR